MSKKLVKAVVGVGLVAVGVITANKGLIFAGVGLVASVLAPQPSIGEDRAAAAITLQLGEQPRQAIGGRAGVKGSLVDAFNYGGKYNTDWEVLVLALADNHCDGLEGVIIEGQFYPYTGDGAVAGFNNQLEVYWRDGSWDQSVPQILLDHGPGWTANDRGRGVAYVVVAYKGDEPDAENPVWTAGRPRFTWVLRGMRCYQARKDGSLPGGSGSHRRDNPATWEWTENVIDVRYNWVRGIYAGNRVNQPEMLLIGRGLSAIEAPPENVFARANLCDEIVDGQARYTCGGLISSTEPYGNVENDFAAACGGIIVQPQGAVEIDPGEARAPVAHFTDADLITTSKVQWSDFLSRGDRDWVNTVIPRFTDPAQEWQPRGAPVQRETADVIADGGPRETTLQLGFVTNAKQAQRVGQIVRRFGRLWGRGQVTLPPRFAFIEEGDWVTWQSDLHFKGATFTFRVDAWGSNEDWHHQISLRQISASVYSDTAPLDDGVVANNQAEPPAVAAPAADAWQLAASPFVSNSVTVPGLLLTGAVDDPAAEFINIEYVQQTAVPNASTEWVLVSNNRPDLRTLRIPVPAGGRYYVAVSYVVDGVTGARRVLGPVDVVGLAYPDGTDFADLQPSEPGANRSTGALADADTIDLEGPQVTGLLRRERAATVLRNENVVLTNLGGVFRLSGGGSSDDLGIEDLGYTGDLDANRTTNTNQLTDGAGLGDTAIYTQVLGRPTALSGINITEANKLFAIEPFADVTANAQLSIEPEFPSIVINEGEAGNVGTRTVSHQLLKGTTAQSGVVWDLLENGTDGTVFVNSAGVVSLSGIGENGFYRLRGTKDGASTIAKVNVTFNPTISVSGGSGSGFKLGSNNAGWGTNNGFTQLVRLTFNDVVAGSRVVFNRFGFGAGAEGCVVEPVAGSGSASYQARLAITQGGNTTYPVVTDIEQAVSGGALGFVDFSSLFNNPVLITSSGVVHVDVEIRRVSGTGQVTEGSNVIDADIIPGAT